MKTEAEFLELIADRLELKDSEDNESPAEAPEPVDVVYDIISQTETFEDLRTFLSLLVGGGAIKVNKRALRDMISGTEVESP